jgi:hypothetical protein
MLDVLPQTIDDGKCKRVSIKIRESSVQISAFEEETKGDGILQFYIFLLENVRCTKEKLTVENFDHDITQFT